MGTFEEGQRNEKTARQSNSLTSSRERIAALPTPSTNAALMSLQTSLGNGAVQRRLTSNLAQRQRGVSSIPMHRFGPENTKVLAARAGDVLDRASSSSGDPLPDAVRGPIEVGLGADLSAVRVHTGRESAAAAHTVGATAYTVGQNIHFAAGRYAPSSSSGMRLLIHEAAHTVQQQHAGALPARELNMPESRNNAEVEAERVADFVIQSGTQLLPTPTSLQPITTPVIQREVDPDVTNDEESITRSSGESPDELAGREAHEGPDARQIAHNRDLASRIKDPPLQKTFFTDLAEGVLAGGLTGALRGATTITAQASLGGVLREIGALGTRYSGASFAEGSVKAMPFRASLGTRLARRSLPTAIADTIGGAAKGVATSPIFRTVRAAAGAVVGELDDEIADETRAKNLAATLPRDEDMALDNQSYADGRSAAPGMTGVADGGAGFSSPGNAGPDTSFAPAPEPSNAQSQDEQHTETIPELDGSLNFTPRDEDVEQ